eukprot:5751766-Lingulodinium_polyedra.AAC.1
MLRSHLGERWGDQPHAVISPEQCLLVHNSPLRKFGERGLDRAPSAWLKLCPAIHCRQKALGNSCCNPLITMG